MLSSCAGKVFLKQRYTNYNHLKIRSEVNSPYLLKAREEKIPEIKVVVVNDYESVENKDVFSQQQQGKEQVKVNSKKHTKTAELKNVVIKSKDWKVDQRMEEETPAKGVDLFLNVLYFLVCLALFVSIIVFLFINPWISLIIWAGSWAIVGIIASIAWLIEKHKEKHTKEAKPSS